MKINSARSLRHDAEQAAFDAAHEAFTKSMGESNFRADSYTLTLSYGAFLERDLDPATHRASVAITFDAPAGVSKKQAEQMLLAAYESLTDEQKAYELDRVRRHLAAIGGE